MVEIDRPGYGPLCDKGREGGCVRYGFVRCVRLLVRACQEMCPKLVWDSAGSRKID